MGAEGCVRRGCGVCGTGGAAHCVQCITEEPQVWLRGS